MTDKNLQPDEETPMIEDVEHAHPEIKMIEDVDNAHPDVEKLDQPTEGPELAEGKDENKPVDT